MKSELAEKSANQGPIGRHEIGTRIGVVADMLGDRKSAAEAAEVSKDSLQRYIRAEVAPPFEVIAKMCALAGVSLDWVATGKGSIKRSESAYAVNEAAQPYVSEIGAEFTLVPRYNVAAAAGAGQAVDRENEIGKLAFRQDWLRHKGLRGADLAVIRVKGDSMAPTIRDGSLALVDCRQQHEKPKTDGIYVIQMDGDLLAKRIQIDLAGDGALYIKSDNPAYTEQHLNAEAADRLWIVGRVIWAGGEI